MDSATAKAYGVYVEQEPIGENQTRSTLTLLLAARRCPIECVFCDLWKHNHPEPTPAGSIPNQIAVALDSVPKPDRTWALKLYNGGNFTDPLSIPPADWPSIAKLCNAFGRVIVENHATLCGDRLLRFSELLIPKLEVAVGLETSNPTVLARQQKQMTLDDFGRAAEFLHANNIALRCFVMLQMPYADPRCCVDDALQSVLHAARAGAVFVAIIPTRSDTSEMKRFTASGYFTPPTLMQLETALRRSLLSVAALGMDCIVTADTWDIEAVSNCQTCQTSRIKNIVTMNLTQQSQQISVCAKCG